MSHQRFRNLKNRKSPTRRARPRLEALEDRTAPAVLVVTSTADTVTNDGQLTLREAIQAATTNAAVDGSPAGEATPDTIVFAANLQGQTITLGGTELALTGGGELSIVGPGGVRGGITVDANNASRVFNISSVAAVRLTNLTLTGGNAGAGDTDGGALVNTGTGTITLTNARVTNSTASGANADGGGIFNTGTLVLDNTEVTNNTANDDGGGIYNDGGTLTIRNGSRVSGNSTISDDGGGLLVALAASSVTIEDSTIAGNTADGGGEGGGIRQNNGTVTIRRSTISGNVADTDGGGIDFVAGTLNVVNSTITANVAGQDGGGLQTSTGTATITNTTIARNAAISDGGGVNRVSGTTTLNNSIVALNQAGTGDDINGTVTNNDTFVGTADGNPRLGPLQDNGGPTFTLAPLSGSPVIDAGTNALAVDPVTGATLTTDQRGFPRTIAGTVDQGAVERFSASTTVTLEVLQDGMAVTGTSTARPVTLRATVTSGTPGVTPTGTVNFFRDPTPANLTDEPILLNSTPIEVDDMGVAVLPNVPLSSTSGVFATFVPSSSAFEPSSSASQTVTATVQDTVGVFDPNAVFSLLNENTTTTTGPDFSYSFGFFGSQPVVGNWTGSPSEVDLPGVVRIAGAFLEWTLSDDNPPVLPNLPSFQFGAAGQIAVSGNWDGTGADGIGVYDPTNGNWFLRNSPTGSGGPDFAFAFGGPGFLPVVGDWDGDGTDTVGVYNPATGTWVLAGNNPASGFPTPFGPAFTFNPTGSLEARPVAGDWDGDGTDGIGLFFPQTGAAAGFGGFLLRNTPDAGPADVNGGNVILAGLSNWVPLAGNWGIAPTTTNELLNPPPMMMPLMLGEGGTPGGQAISDALLQSAAGGAFSRLSAAGADPAVLDALLDARFLVADLPGSALGLADPSSGRVLIDVDGAGAGWFVDGTPLDDSEFGSNPVAGVDLLTALLHELGHLAGAGHDEGGLMAESLPAGVRHTDALDAAFGMGPVHEHGEEGVAFA